MRFFHCFSVLTFQVVRSDRSPKPAAPSPDLFINERSNAARKGRRLRPKHAGRLEVTVHGELVPETQMQTLMNVKLPEGIRSVVKGHKAQNTSRVEVTVDGELVPDTKHAIDVGIDPQIHESEYSAGPVNMGLPEHRNGSIETWKVGCEGGNKRHSEKCNVQESSPSAALQQKQILHTQTWASRATQMSDQVWFACGMLTAGLLLFLLNSMWRRVPSAEAPEPEKAEVIEVEDHHDDHHHEEVDAFIKHDSYVMARSSERRSIPVLLDYTPVIPEIGPPRCNEWLTPEECDALGVPPLGRMMWQELKRPPWEWSDSIEGWSRVPFPWDGLQLQKFLQQFNIHKSDDPNDFSMPAKLVEQFTQGRCIWKYKSRDNRKEVERITPLMVLRVIDPSGRILVRASRKVLKNNELKLDDRPQYPGRAHGQPDEVLEEASHLLRDQCSISPDILKFSIAEATLSEPRNCNMLAVQVRFFRHFINAEIRPEFANDATTSKRLGLAEGGFCIKTGDAGEQDNFEWWTPSRCDEKMPKGHLVHAHAAPEVAGGPPSTDDDVFLVMPWTAEAVERCLRRNKVNTSHVRTMREEIARKLEDETYHLVHNVKHELDRSHHEPSIALLSEDGQTFFFAPRGANPVGYA
eukprot:gnl/MRDRNA2_/MRDRNA2_176382_c0_seq1.p1 gnl/MRDRNA2_/MRDRNA2_176382_c0~~gnl/MRDRNA2_/MRDRNA2_176382_c0_seq1.p1  ORF type:complete len:635 (-),score=98.26 gnl/MRDRNA2_/MRDRNA2_176382_c0_seq1:52-1956(-)